MVQGRSMLHVAVATNAVQAIRALLRAGVSASNLYEVCLSQQHFMVTCNCAIVLRALEAAKRV